MNNSLINKLSLILLGIIVLLLFVLGYSYSFFLINPSQDTQNNAYTACLSISGNLNNTFNDTNSYPMTFTTAKSVITPVQLNIHNDCTTNGDFTYNIYLEVPNSNTLSANLISVALNDTEFVSLKDITPTYDVSLYSEGSKYLIATDTLDNDNNTTLNLRMWIDESVTSAIDSNSVFNSKISVEAVPTYD